MRKKAAKTKKVEIYGLHDPRTGELRYIGKANDVGKRFKDHLRETRRRTPLYDWIKMLRGLGLVPRMEVLECCGVGAWQEAEIRAIADARAAGIRLLNVAEGGNEPFCSTEIRAENGRKSVAARTSTPLKARVYQLKRHIGQLLKAGYVNEATKAKLRLAAGKRPELFGAWSSL